MAQLQTTDIKPQRDPGAPPLLRADQGPVAVLTLNRPEARNCLSEDLLAALHAAIAEIGGSDAIRAIVITGAGTAFSSGHDLKELSSHRSDSDRGKAYFAKIMDACSRMMLSIVRSPKPVIAAVNGIGAADLGDGRVNCGEQIFGKAVSRLRPVEREHGNRALVRPQ